MLQITVDTGAETITEIHTISWEKMKDFIPIIKRIANFKPYDGLYRDSITKEMKERICSNNYPSSESAEIEYGERSATMMYGKYPLFREFHALVPYDRDGYCKSITSINILQIKERLL